MTLANIDHWPAHRVEMRSRASLRAFDRNSRTHSDEQVQQIAASIREWGWTMPVLVTPDGEVIAGHGRLLAAAVLGVDEVPCMIAVDWTEAQRRAYVIADNKLAENAGWDEEIRAAEMAFLRSVEFDIDLVGFSDEELAGILGAADAPTGDPEAIPDVPVHPVAAAGDVWVLGRHRIACGSSTDPETVTRVLAGVTPHLMVTDPPYGLKYDPAWRERAGVNTAGAATGQVLNDDNADWRAAWALFPGDVAYVWHSGLFAGVVAESLMAVGFQLRSQIIWAKNNWVISRGDYHWQHEPCWYAVRKGRTGRYDGGRSQSTLWQIDKPRKSDTGHSTQKPVDCMKRPIENNSSPGQAIYEPFSGSGTTIIACEMTGRACHAVELNPAYVDVAVQRWQEFTGQTAVLEGESRTFEEVRLARAEKAA